MKRRQAATPYAKAPFVLAKERDQTEPVGRELGDAAVTFGSVAELRDLFARPWILATAKRAVARSKQAPGRTAARRRRRRKR